MFRSDVANKLNPTGHIVISSIDCRRRKPELSLTALPARKRLKNCLPDLCLQDI